MLKAYINCFRKAHILETSPAVILFDSIRRLPGREDEKIALDKLESFLIPKDGGFEGTSVLEPRSKAYMIGTCQNQRLVRFHFSSGANS
jgi:hypothetical protein